MRLQQGGDVGCSRNAIHRHHCQKHQQRSSKRIEEEFEARVAPPRMSPDADDEEHRDEAALEEKIEQHEIESTKDAGHQCLENEESNQIFLDSNLNRLPRREDANWHQKSGQKDEGKRNSVDTHFIGEAIAKPAFLLDKLKGGGRRIKLRIDIEREQKDDESGAKRSVAGVIQCGFIIAAKGENERCTGKRQEDKA